MKLNNLQKQITKRPQLQYIHKNIGMNKITNQPPPPNNVGPGGHYDAYIEGKPRLKKYFGGSFLPAI
jgi:hypothetical protein